MSINKQPPLHDFSQTAIERVVALRIRNNPLTLWSGVVGFAALLLPIAWYGWAELPLIWMVFAGFGFTCSGINLLVDHRVRRHGYASELVKQRRDWLLGETDRLVERLRCDLTVQKRTRALAQLEELELSYRDLCNLLASRFSDQGLAMDRFAGQALDLREHILALLVQTQDLLAAVASIPVDKLRRLKNAEANERVQHYEDAYEEVETILNKVEQGLNQLSAITLEVARVGSADTTAFNQCIEQMSRLTSDMTHFKREL